MDSTEDAPRVPSGVAESVVVPKRDTSKSHDKNSYEADEKNSYQLVRKYNVPCAMCDGTRVCIRIRLKMRNTRLKVASNFRQWALGALRVGKFGPSP